MVSPKTWSCLQLDPSHIDRMFNQNVLAGFDTGHLVGAVRLLLFIEFNFDKFKPMDTTQTADGEAALEKKSRFAARFSKFGSGEEFTVIAIYEKTQGRNLPHGIPRTIIITTTNAFTSSLDTRPWPRTSSCLTPRARTTNRWTASETPSRSFWTCSPCKQQIRDKKIKTLNY